MSTLRTVGAASLTYQSFSLQLT